MKSGICFVIPVAINFTMMFLHSRVMPYDFPTWHRTVGLIIDIVCHECLVRIAHLDKALSLPSNIDEQ